VPDPVLTLLKYVFLAILYLFFLRVLRAVWVEMREPKVPVVTDEPPRRRRAAREKPPEKLVVVDPVERKGTEFALTDEVTVGRAAGCGVLLDEDTFVSQLHARLFRRDGQLFVEDLGSTNGTFLNKNKVTAPVAVRKGDQIQFGRTTLEVRR
jgi:hypothetical protein